MKELIISILIFTTYFVNAQEKVLSNDSDTLGWYKNHVEFINELGMNEINSFQNDTVYRFWDGSKVIQIRKSVENYNGKVFFFLRECSSDTGESKRLYSSSMKLDLKTITKILQLFSDFKIYEYPSDFQIQGWEQGCDGCIYLTEYNCPNNYAIKTYWTPTAQEKVKEARLIQYFINELNNIKEINAGYKKFMENQPFNSYFKTIEGTVIVTILK